MSLESGSAVSNIRIQVQPSDTVGEGSRVRLTCSADGDAIYYEWRREGGKEMPAGTVTSNNVLE